MDLEYLIESFSTEPADYTYTVTRRTAATMVDGRPVPNTPLPPIEIIASVQPASGRDLLRLPEGRRTNETRTIYTKTKLYTSYEGSLYDADVVTVDGQDWEVQEVQNWHQPGGDDYFRCIVQAVRT